MSGEFPPSVVETLRTAARTAAPCWGLPADSQCSVLSISENLTLHLQAPPPPSPPAPSLQMPSRTDSGLALRLHRNGYHSTTEIRSELTWIEALRRDQVIATPAPVRTRNEELLHAIADPHGPSGQRWAVAFEFVKGHTPTPQDADLPSWFFRLGQITARLHQHARQWNRPDDFQRKSWTVERLIGRTAYWGPWQNAMGLDGTGATVLTQTETAIRNHMTAFGDGPDEFGLIHGDLRLANLLVVNDDLHVIDFDDCGLGWFLYDFAAAISFHECDPAVGQWHQAWIDGYRQALPLTDRQLGILPTLVMMRRLQLTAWLASHHEIPLARELGPAFTDDTVALAQDYLHHPHSLTLPVRAH